MIHHYFFGFYRTKVEPKIEPNSQKECTLFASSNKKEDENVSSFSLNSIVLNNGPHKIGQGSVCKKMKNFEKLMLKNEKDANN